MADLLQSDAAPSRLAVPALITAGAAGILFLGAIAPATDTADRLARVSLAAGDSTPALFDAKQLVPGHPVSSCLTVAGQSSGREVRLAASELSGPLVTGLRLRVEVGTGACTVFTGQTVFDGTLSGLAAAGPAGIATGWAPSTPESRTYRLTVEVADDDQLQRTSGGATFTWLRGPAVTPTSSAPTTPSTPATPTAPTTSPAPSTSPSTLPPTSPGTGPSNSPSAEPSASPSTSPSPSPAPTETADDADPGATPGRTTPPAVAPAQPDPPRDSGWGWSSIVADVAETAWKLLVATAGHPWYLAISLSAMWLFLFIADRREKRDPKLSLAPVLRDPYLTFPRNEDHRGDLD